MLMLTISWIHCGKDAIFIYIPLLFLEQVTIRVIPNQLGLFPKERWHLLFTLIHVDAVLVSC
jgi:hypothetical protein